MDWTEKKGRLEGENVKKRNKRGGMKKGMRGKR